MHLKEPNDLYGFLAKFKMLSRGLAMQGNSHQPARQTGGSETSLSQGVCQTPWELTCGTGRECLS